MENRTNWPSLDVPLPRWGFNPSGWNRRIPICVLAALTFLIATYMALYQWRLISDVWDPVFGEQTRAVLDSEISERLRGWFRIPDAALGAIAYLGDVILGLAGSTRRWQFRPWLVFAFGMLVIPVGVVGIILVVLQPTVVGAWCFPCLLTAGLSLAMISLAWNEVWTSLKYLVLIGRRTHSARLVWNTLWGRPSPEAHDVAEAMIAGRAWSP